VTDEERMALLERIAANHAGAGKGGRLECAKCRYKAGSLEGELGRCSNPLTAAHYGSDIVYIDLQGMRTARGLCGPNALMWERRHWWRFIRWYKAVFA